MAKQKQKTTAKKSKPKKLAAGDHVVTNDEYHAIVGATHEGELIAPQRWCEGLWTVRLHHPLMGLRPQLINACMMEKFTEEHMGTPTKDKPLKMEGMVWVKTDRNQWTCEDTKSRIRMLDPTTYTVMRGGKYLGSEKTLEAAAARAKANKISDRNRQIQEWERTKPNEMPPGLSAVEQAEYTRRHPLAEPQGRKRGPDPIRAKVAAAVGKERRANAKGKERNAELLQLLARGCTREEILRVTGWKAVSVQAMAKSLDVGLRIDNSSKPYKYFSTEKK